MRKTMWGIVFGTMLVAGNALADAAPAAPAAPPPKAHTAKYGTAGCGLGSMIITGGGIVQIFAATTNATSYTQTFGITSGTSNCEDTDGGGSSARVFVDANRVALAKDISRGTGETIIGLSAIAGCTDPKAVGETLQRNFATIFPNASVSNDAVTGAILSTLKSDASLSCSAVGG